MKKLNSFGKGGSKIKTFKLEEIEVLDSYILVSLPEPVEKERLIYMEEDVALKTFRDHSYCVVLAIGHGEKYFNESDTTNASYKFKVGDKLVLHETELLQFYIDVDGESKGVTLITRADVKYKINLQD